MSYDKKGIQYQSLVIGVLSNLFSYIKQHICFIFHISKKHAIKMSTDSQNLRKRAKEQEINGEQPPRKYLFNCLFVCYFFEMIMIIMKIIIILKN